MATSANATQLQELYVAYFGRAADPAGLDYWEEAGITTAEFAADMYAQAEFKDAYGSLSVEAQVNQIYKNLFDREADVTGLAYWTQQINLGVLKVAEIANDLIWAAQNNAGSEDDKTALLNRTNAAIAYTAEVGLTTAGRLAYQPITKSPFKAGDNFTEAKNYLAGIDKDTAYTAAGITASVATITANGVPAEAVTAVNAVLTSNTDVSLSSSAGADTYSALVSTLTAGDTIDGGAGSDTLNLVANLASPTTLVGFTTTSIENFNVTVNDSDTAAAEVLTVNMSSSTPTTIKLSGETTTTRSDGATFTNVASGVNLSMKDATDLDAIITYKTAAREGTADSATLTLNNVLNTAAADTDITYTSGGTDITSINTLNIVTTGAASNIGNLAFGGSTLIVTGDQTLDIDDDLESTIDLIDASAFTGKLDIDMADDTTTPDATVDSVDVVDITIKGGSNNDTIDLVNVGTNDEILVEAGAGDDVITIGAAITTTTSTNAGDVIKGGEGTDTLIADVDLVDNAAIASTAALTTISGIETLNLSGAMGGSDTVVLSTISSEINRVNISSVTSTALTLTYGSGDSTLGLNIAAAVTSGDTLTASAAGSGTADTLTITNMLTTGDSGSAGSVYSLSGFETVTFNTSEYATAAVQNVNTFAIGANTLKILGSNAFTTAGAVTATTIDGSGATGAITLGAAAASVTTITGGSGSDTLTGDASSTIDGGAGNDVIVGGTGNDTLTGGAGNDTVTSSGGVDTIDLGAGNDSVNMDAGLAAADTVAGGAGTDTLFVDDAATASEAYGVSGFEILAMDTTAKTQNMANFSNNNTFTTIDVHVAGTLTVTNALDTVTTLRNTTTGGTASITRLVDGSSNALSIEADDSSSASQGVTTFVAVTANDEETLTMVSGSNAAEDLTITTLTSVDLTSLTLTGTADAIITNAIASATKLATIDASGLTGRSEVHSSASTVAQTFTAGSGGSEFTGGIGADTVTGGSGVDVFIGGAGNDVISAGAGADTKLDGGVGADTLTGGAGDDNFVMTITEGIAATSMIDVSTGAEHAAAATIAVGDYVIFENGVDIITDFTAGAGGVDDVNTLVASTATTGIGQVSGAVHTNADDIVFFSGNYVTSTKTFTITADGEGSDTLITVIDQDVNNNMVGTLGHFILQGVDSDDLVGADFI